MSGQQTPAGWYPQADGSQRYWNGERWTEHVNHPSPPQWQRQPNKVMSGWKVAVIVVCAVVGGIVGMLVFGGGATSGSKPTPDVAASLDAQPMFPSPSATRTVDSGLGSQDASGDVALGAPSAPDSLGAVDVPVIIVNHSAKRSNYFVELSAESADGKQQFGTGNAFAANVEPGQTATAQAYFSGNESPAGAVFVVKSVQRTATS